MKLIKSLFITALLIPVLAFGQTDASANFVVGLAGVDINKASVKPLYELGVPYFGKQGVFIYGKCTETISDGSWVFISDTNTLTLADHTESASDTHRVGVAATDCTTAAPYIWVWGGEGVFEALVDNAVAANTAIQVGSAGSKDGIAVSGANDAITGCKNIDVGVTSTRVTVQCANLACTNC